MTISFTDRDGDVQTVRAKLGDNLLEVAREYDIDLEGVLDRIFVKSNTSSNILLCLIHKMSDTK